LKTFHAERMRVLAAGFISVLGLATSFGARAAVSPPRPTEFDICQGCHGVFAQGNAELGAPRIAGLDAQYLGRQLADFRDSRRGAGAGDAFGAQMVTIASMLDDTTIGRLAAYVSAMPEVQVPTTLSGDGKAGRAAYTTCAACHGVNGEGSVSLGAPRLAGMTDSYLARQFAAYASGMRGSAAGDDRGAAMRGITAGVKGDKAVRDVISYAVSLPGPATFSATACADHPAGACGSSR
jgi:cytochrome c oxidase subunit 2